MTTFFEIAVYIEREDGEHWQQGFGSGEVREETFPIWRLSQCTTKIYLNNKN